MKRHYTFGEHLFFATALICWLSVPVMIAGGIWSDARWFATSVLMLALGLFFAWIGGKTE